VLPAVAAGFLLVFILSLAEFSVPALLRVRVFAIEIYTQFSAFYDFGAATAAAFPLLVVILIIAFLIRWLLGDRIVSSRRSLSSSPLMTPSSWLPFGKLLSIAVLMLSVLLPILSLTMKVDRPGTLWRSMDNSGAEIWNSLALSAAAAVLAVGLGLFLGYWRARTNVRWKRVADAVWISLFALPGTVLGIGMVRLWNQPGLMAFYGSWGIVIVALVARFTPMAALLLAENVRQLSISWEEAAFVHGAKWWRSLGGIVIPNLKKGLWAAGFLIFVLAFGEVAITILLIPPGRSTLSMKIFATIANSPDSVLASLCLFQTTVILVPLFIASAMVLRPRRLPAKEARGLCL
jgi:iron(III) transport system permease protein